MKVINENIRRVLIYRLGHLGDTVVALPALHLVARTFPNAERRLLTNFSSNSKAAPMRDILDGTRLIHGYQEYPAKLRDPRNIVKLMASLKVWQPEVIVYLTDARGHLKAIRDALFFKLSGAHYIIGLPLSRSLQKPTYLQNGLYENRAVQLARRLHNLGDALLTKRESWSLSLTEAEAFVAKQAISNIPLSTPLISASIGAKISIKDWGDANWKKTFEKLSEYLNGWGLIFMGSEGEFARSDLLRKFWKGPSLNLCGKLSVRESAAALSYTKLFLGHDSGPMHLAASQNVPCVAIFSARNLPGEWYPWGAQHQILYPSVPCKGCYLEVCKKHKGPCISLISPEQVVNAALILVRKLNNIHVNSSIQ